jgi:hypothetical protein
MRTFVAKLATWHRLVKDLEYARVRLAQAEAEHTRFRAASVNDRLIGPGELAVQVSQTMGVMAAREDPTRCDDEPSEIAGRNHEEANFWDEPSTRYL